MAKCMHAIISFSAFAIHISYTPLERSMLHIYVATSKNSHQAAGCLEYLLHAANQ